MGWGWDDVVDIVKSIVVNYVIGIYSYVVDGITYLAASNTAGNTVSTVAWKIATKPPDQSNFFPYQGGQSYNARVGWPIDIGIAAYGSPGVVPEGVFFLGHAAPGMSFDSMVMTQTGAALVDDYFLNGGLVAKLIQRDATGKIIYISGFETGVDREGTIYREDLSLSLKSPLRAVVSYGGEITEYLPMYIVVSKTGNTGSATGIDTLQAQVVARFFVQQVL